MSTPGLSMPCGSSSLFSGQQCRCRAERSRSSAMDFKQARAALAAADAHCHNAPRQPTALGIDEHSRVEHALRIELSFYRPKRGREKLRTLTIVPWPVITGNGVMMRDRAPRLDQRVAGRILDRLPLFQKRTVAAKCVERKI